MPFGLLIARQRSGTGALGSVLDKHPQLHYVGEIFHPANIGQDKNYFSHLLHKAREDRSVFLPDRNGANLKTFLESITDSGIIPIIDIKYNSLHHLNGGWQSPLTPPWILQHAPSTGVPIIHLTRRNFVEVFVSGRLAEANQVWHARKAEEAKIRSVAIDPQALLRFIRHAQEEQSLIERWLVGHSPLVMLDYGEMFDTEGMLSQKWAEKIANNFSVNAFIERTSHFIKQAPDSLKESILNYEEVKRVLSGMEYEWMIGEYTSHRSINAPEHFSLNKNTKAMNNGSTDTPAGPKDQYCILRKIFDQPPVLSNYICHWSKKHQYVYVETPKAACTTIKRVLQEAETGSELVYDKPGDVHNRLRSPLLSPTSDMAAFAAAMHDKDYFRFCFVRNPFIRILSCYLDKMVKNQFERKRLAPKLGIDPENPPSFNYFLHAVAEQQAENAIFIGHRRPFC